MAIKIGHASIDENGKIKNGNSGDQTNKEVCIRTWYSKGWQYVLRPKNSVLAEKSALACEAGCANNNIGYDQNQRNNLYKYAKAVNFDLAKIKTKCECDCSSFMQVCAIAGGANLSYGSNGYTTSTMVNAFVKSGDYEKLTDTKYLTSDKYLKRGDILVRAGSHTVMALENGSLAKNTSKQGGKTVTITLSVLEKGSKGEEVKTLQRLLISMGYSCGTAGVDGDFGNSTLAAVKKYQSANKLVVDGSVGQKTWTSILK